MKTTLTAAAALALAVAAASSEEPRILGRIADGTATPAAPQPVYEVRSSDIVETTTRRQGGRDITLQRIKPIPLPPPPAPAAEPSAEQLAAFEAALVDYRENHVVTGLLFLGATVYRSDDGSPPRSLVRWWPQHGGKTIVFWSSADFSLISGISSFADTAGNIHSLLMGWGFSDPAELQTSRGFTLGETQIPNFPEGPATFQIVGETPAAADLAPIEAIHQLYNNELARLQTAFTSRETARLAHEAELKANPPHPKDLTLRFWRTETPAAPATGGAR